MEDTGESPEAEEILEAEDRRVYWVGLPVMREAYDARKAGVMNEAYAAGVRGRPGFRFVPTWSLFSDAQGRYSEYLPDETGRRRLHRAGDGIHFTRAGARRLSRVLVDLLEREWELDRWWQMQPRLGCTLGETEELR